LAVLPVTSLAARSAADGTRTTSLLQCLHFTIFFSEKVGRKEIELTRVHPISKMFQDLMAGIKPQALRRDVGRLSGSSFLCSEYATMFCN
jgi:hypothetical protein